MPTISDSHCHLSRFSQAHAVAEAAQNAGVVRLLMPAVDESDFAALIALHRPPHRHAAIGLHPWYVRDDHHTALATLDRLLAQHPDIWLGETGLDFHPKHRHNWAAQQTAFTAHIHLAQNHRRPMIVHNVRATTAIVAACRRARYQQSGIVHAFAGSLEEAQQLRDCGFMLGISHLILHPNALKARRTATLLPLDCILLETDSPYNHHATEATPQAVWQVAHTLAQLRDIDPAELIAACEHNLTRLLTQAT